MEGRHINMSKTFSLLLKLRHTYSMFKNKIVKSSAVKEAPRCYLVSNIWGLLPLSEKWL
jgi:hypothetical protein